MVDNEPRQGVWIAVPTAHNASSESGKMSQRYKKRISIGFIFFLTLMFPVAIIVLFDNEIHMQPNVCEITSSPECHRGCDCMFNISRDNE